MVSNGFLMIEKRRAALGTAEKDSVEHEIHPSKYNRERRPTAEGPPTRYNDPMVTILFYPHSRHQIQTAKI